MRKYGLKLPFPATLLPFYPLVFLVLKWFCDGEFTPDIPALRAFQSFQLAGHSFRIEGLGVAALAGLMWFRIALVGRAYSLPSGEEWLHVNKWDPADWQVAALCLLSPVHLVLLLQNEGGQPRPGKDMDASTLTALLWATGTAVLALSISHLFLRREGIQWDLYNGTYAKKVDEQDRIWSANRALQAEGIERRMPKYAGGAGQEYAGNTDQGS
mmetsp:Transcript_57324/g.136287  ORF Transcript_57324/g.136287 Transcript_57324/m.136287 type:complete len:213 (+) Transcript_57324:111-749(+)|eukprot:CAMPEP_0180135806 /NCGR_PEP_ID=MMETSP0986-20121125/11071_1 /TAXON_ID=697907 /ORGANISM="non described non described, Strain CCMP2293" /LENGTH=212 /DNA_ID=CAMNT_0022076617 /DNA_START=111 /DNA_END=749 /DNA_ORIENTATION=-